MQLCERDNTLAIDDEQYRAWIATTEPARIRARIDAARQQCATHTPTISILLPTHDTAADFLRQALDSVLAQIYPHWQLCIVDDASTQPHVRELLERYARSDARIAVQFQPHNRGIAATTNSALEMATGEYVALLDHDDVLSPDALLCVAAATADPRVQVLYSDCDRLDASGQRVAPFFKPGWNYELLLGQNYFNHLTVYATRLLRDMGGWREGFEGSQDYDVLLRAVEHLPDACIRHVPEILYHWREVATSVSRTNLGAAVRAARQTIREHLQRTGRRAQVKPCTGAVLYNRIEWTAPPDDAVAVAVYGPDRAAVEATRDRLRAAAPGARIDGVVLGADDFQPLNDWARRQVATALGFVAAGFELEENALPHLAGHMGRGDVVAAAAKLVTSDARPLGPLVATPERGAVAAYGAARHRDNAGYAASLLLDRRVGLLQAGCLFVQAAAFRAAGGWTRPLADSLAAGIDLSWRLRAAGGHLVWSAGAVARSRSAQLDALLVADGGSAVDMTDDNFNDNVTL